MEKSVRFVIPTDPNDMGIRLYSRKDVEIFPGLTPLVGCNGVGKTTFLILLEERLRNRKECKYLKYNNLTDGGTNSIEAMFFRGNTELGAAMIMSSEGERIRFNIGQIMGKIGKMVREDMRGCKELWVLLDAVGSGLSVDNIDEIKDIVPFVQEQDPNIDFYFIVSTNEYEFARNEKCLYVTNMSYVEFKDYEEYRNFILKSRETRDKKDKKKKGNE